MSGRQSCFDLRNMNGAGVLIVDFDALSPRTPELDQQIRAGVVRTFNDPDCRKLWKPEVISGFCKAFAAKTRLTYSSASPEKLMEKVTMDNADRAFSVMAGVLEKVQPKAFPAFLRNCYADVDRGAVKPDPVLAGAFESAKQRNLPVHIYAPKYPLFHVEQTLLGWGVDQETVGRLASSAHDLSAAMGAQASGSGGEFPKLSGVDPKRALLVTSNIGLLKQAAKANMGIFYVLPPSGSLLRTWFGALVAGRGAFPNAWAKRQDERQKLKAAKQAGAIAVGSSATVINRVVALAA